MSLKRSFDIVFSLLGLVLCLPVFLIVPLMISFDSKGPVFFSQERIGKDFKPFTFYKFRTMIISAQESGPQITAGGDFRITRLGKYLRKFKIDEFPQFYNVLKGDISFVGPRPEAKKYVDLFYNEFKHILSVKPGITDYAALEYRSEEMILGKYENPEQGYISEILPHKIELSRRYIAEQSLWIDIKIIMLTLWRIVCG